MKFATTLRWLFAAALVFAAASAMAQDILKLAIGQRGNWGECGSGAGPEGRVLQKARPDA